MTERAPFHNAADALRYLFDAERPTTVSRSAIARWADGTLGDPGPLAGLDGAATAGSAKAMLEGRLTQLQLVVLAARYAPSRRRCECKADCCSGWKTNPKWREAIDYLAHEALYRALAGLDAMYVRYVTAVLLKEYGQRKIAVTDVGTDLGLSLGSCANYKRAILSWLLRAEAIPEEVVGNKKTLAQPQGMEVQAFAAAEEALRQGGFIR